MSYLASLHGHSKYSDGHATPGEIVTAAHTAGITYLALTDHYSIQGVKDLYESAEHLNQISSTPVIPVAGIEMLTSHGEILILKPAPYEQAKPFLDWCQNFIDKQIQPDLFTTVKTAIENYKCLVIFSHPNLYQARMLSVSFNTLSQLCDHLDSELHPYLGVETRNWSTKIFIHNNHQRERQVEQLASKLSLAQIGGTDYHATWQLAFQTTVVPHADVPSYDAFIKSFLNRDLKPGPNPEFNIHHFFRLITTLVPAFIHSLSHPTYPFNTIIKY